MYLFYVLHKKNMLGFCTKPCLYNVTKNLDKNKICFQDWWHALQETILYWLFKKKKK